MIRVNRADRGIEVLDERLYVGVIRHGVFEGKLRFMGLLRSLLPVGQPGAVFAPVPELDAGAFGEELPESIQQLRVPLGDRDVGEAEPLGEFQLQHRRLDSNENAIVGPYLEPRPLFIKPPTKRLKPLRRWLLSR